MKKLILAAILVVSASFASAQSFEKGDVFLQGQLTGLDLGVISNDGNSMTSFDLQADGGYFFSNFLAAEATLGFEYAKEEGLDATNALTYGIGLRAYPVRNLFAGVGFQGYATKDQTLTSGLNVRVGYDLFVSEKVFFEPALYYKKGLSEGIKKVNAFGLQLGIGVRF